MVCGRCGEYIATHWLASLLYWMATRPSMEPRAARDSVHADYAMVGMQSPSHRGENPHLHILYTIIHTTFGS